MTVNRAALAHSTLNALEAAIKDRIIERRVFYRTPVGRMWVGWARENDMLLRELFKIRRRAKRTAIPMEPVLPWSYGLEQYQVESR